jgi:hypothetical protein
LKETKKPELGPRAVELAAEAIVRAGRRDDTVVMVYQPTDEVVALLKKYKLRGGIKGYPENLRETNELVDRAATAGLEMICVNAKYVSPEIIERSASVGVWHLPWSLDSDRIDHWQSLAKAGVGGMIVQHYRAARDRVAPVWIDVRDRDSSDKLRSRKL